MMICFRRSPVPVPRGPSVQAMSTQTPSVQGPQSLAIATAHHDSGQRVTQVGFKIQGPPTNK